jgi:hypothetical protein
VFVEIGTNSRIPTTPFVVQPIAITKPIGPLRGGTCLESIPLHILIFTILIPINIVVNKLVEDNERSDKEQIEPINPSFIVLDIRLESLEFLSTNSPLTSH